MNRVWVWSAALLLTLIVVGSQAFGPDAFDTVMVAAVGSLIVMAIGFAVMRPDERRWLPPTLAIAIFAKLSGAVIRYLVVTEVYLVGDALGYHTSGIGWAEYWRAFTVPEVDEVRRGAGTVFMKLTTSFVYAPHVPTVLGGFITFALIALVGQIGLYVAFRRWVPGRRQRMIYAFIIFFLPTIVFWSASIGKDATIIFLIGVASVGLSAFLAEYRIRWLLLAMVPLIPAFRIRPHIVLLLVGATVVAALIARRPSDPETRSRRMVLVGLAVAGMIAAVPLAADALKIDLTSEGIDTFVDRQATVTSKGGSAVQGSPVRSPADLPGAFLRVLFRPLPHEAGSLQLMLAAAEAVGLIALLAWRLPTMIRNRGEIRSNPYVLMSLLYVLGFVVAFSTVLNLGILARQRVQVFPFLLAAVVALGWTDTPKDVVRSERHEDAGAR